ncbi:MAG: hypothetical protein RLZZ59_853 [Pseudomonadota bacterium]|jgi:hypothetical protein
MSGILDEFEKKIFSELQSKVSAISHEYSKIQGEGKHAFLNEQFDNMRIWADDVAKSNPAFGKIKDIIENLSKASDHFFVGNHQGAAKYHKQAISKIQEITTRDKGSFVSRLNNSRSNASEIQR